MNEAEVRRCAANCRFTNHARKEMDEEPLGRIHVEEVLRIIETGEIIEQYLDDTPYCELSYFGIYAIQKAAPSCLCASFN